MTNTEYKMDSMRLVLLGFLVLGTLTFLKPQIDIGFAQTVSLSKTFQAIDSSYTTDPALVGNQIEENESIVNDYSIKNISLVHNPISNNPTYSVTNATTSVKVGTLEGVDSNKATLSNQSVISPDQQVITGQISFQAMR